MSHPRISVIITNFNEGPELRRTLASVVRNTQSIEEIIVVDDGSDDGSCDGLAAGKVLVLRNETRTGIAFSRNRGSAVAQGNVLCYLDAHQRVGPGCLDVCADTALRMNAIVCPDIRDFGVLGWRLHGADFELCPKRGYFSAKWRQWFQIQRMVRITGLKAPPYLIPAQLFPSVAWCTQLRGWGASEACVSLKAFFVGAAIVHIRGPLSRHRFNPDSHFPVSWEEIYRNQAMIARICFENHTWHKHWLPIFHPHLSEQVLVELNSPSILHEQKVFSAAKLRTDQDFWTYLIKQPLPQTIR